MPIKLYTFAEAAELLHVPETWLRKKASARAVPFTRLGRYIRFTDEHLSRIIDVGEQQPLAGVPNHGLSRRARRTAS